MSDPKHKALNPAAPAVSTSIVVWIVGSVLALLFVVALFYLGSLRWRSSPTDQSAGVAFGDTTERATVRAIQREAATAASLELDRLQSRVEQLLRQADQLDTLRSEWPDLLDRLQTNEDGRALAAQPENVKAFTMLQRADFGPTALAGDVRRRATQLLGDIKLARTTPDNAWSPGRTSLVPVEQDETDIAAAIRTYQDAKQQLQSMIESGRRAGTSPLTLQQAIRDVQADAGEDQARLLAAAKDAADRIVAEALAKAEADKVLALGDAQRMKLETETQQIREQSRLERLTALANDPSIKEKYAALTDKGHIQFAWASIGGRIVTRKTDRAQPMSLTALQSTTVLSNVESFARLMCGYNACAANDRRKRTDYPKTEEDWKRWDEMFRDFKQLAPIWVEMGVLSK